MNVNRIGNGVNGINGAPGGAVPGTAADGGFRALLESRLRPLRASDPAAAVTAAAGVPAAADPSVRLAALGLSERAIGDLESYQEALGNLDVESKDLEPFVTALEERVLGLLELRGQIPADDGLAAVVDRVCAVCYLETVKYRRGDFSS